MTAVLISSKYEDVEPIRMQSLIEKAGHNRFKKEQILTLERDILQVIGFRVHEITNVYNDASILLNSLLINGLSSSDEKMKDIVN